MVAPHISRTRRQAGRREFSEPQKKEATMRLTTTGKSNGPVYVLAQPGITSIQLLLALEDVSQCTVSLTCRWDEGEHIERFELSTMLNVSLQLPEPIKLRKLELVPSAGCIWYSIILERI